MATGYGLSNTYLFGSKAFNSNDMDSFPVLSTSTFVEGDYLTFDSSGRLQQALSANTQLGSGKILVGQALENAQGYTLGATDVKPSIQVLKLNSYQYGVLPLYSATAASAVWNSNLIGVQYELRYISAGVWAVDLDATTNKVVEIIGLADPVNAGINYPNTTGAGTTQYPWVIVSYLAAACVFAS